MTTFRNPDGFSRKNAGEWAANMDFADPLKWQVFYEDFMVASSGLPYGWTNTNTNGTPTISASATLGSTLFVQTLGGADNDASQAYPTSAMMTLVAGKKAYWRSRHKVDKATGTIGEQEIYVGLASVQTTTNFINAGGTALAVDDCVLWASYDGAATWSNVVRVTDVESSEAVVAAYADLTFFELAWEFDGTSVQFWFNNTKYAAITAMPTAAMAPVLYFKAGEAKAAIMYTDYVFCAIERNA